jgi:RNA polymerase sigma-70 factor (ECF subfamily)
MSQIGTADNSGRGCEKDRDTERFLYLLTPAQGRIYAYILSHWPNRVDAEDIMQETVATIWKKFNTYESDRSFLAWAITIAKFTILSFRKKHSSNPIQFDDETLTLLQEKSGEFLDRIDDRLHILKECVGKLPEREFALLKQRYGQELPIQHIATNLHVSVRAIYKSLSHVHNILIRCVRRSLAEGGGI